MSGRLRMARTPSAPTAPCCLPLQRPGPQPAWRPENGGTAQYYRYDDRDRSLVCVSCPADGSAPAGRRHSLEGERGSTSRRFRRRRHRRLHHPDAAGRRRPEHRPAPGDPEAGTDVYEWRDGRHSWSQTASPDWPINRTRKYAGMQPHAAATSSSPPPPSTPPTPSTPTAASTTPASAAASTSPAAPALPAGGLPGHPQRARPKNRRRHRLLRWPRQRRGARAGAPSARCAARAQHRRQEKCHHKKHAATAPSQPQPEDRTMTCDGSHCSARSPLCALGALGALAGRRGAALEPRHPPQPDQLRPGGVGRVLVRRRNVGDTATSGPITLTIHLPTGLTRDSVGRIRRAIAVNPIVNWSCPGAPGDRRSSAPPLARSPATRVNRSLALAVDVAAALGRTADRHRHRSEGGGAPAVGRTRPSRAHIGPERGALRHPPRELRPRLLQGRRAHPGARSRLPPRPLHRSPSTSTRSPRR